MMPMQYENHHRMCACDACNRFWERQCGKPEGSFSAPKLKEVAKVCRCADCAKLLAEPSVTQ